MDGIVKSKVKSSSSNASPLLRSSVTNSDKIHREVEIGAPCLRCHRGCEGLLLHVWRKICINCGCSRDAHQMKAEHLLENLNLDERQGHILQQYVWFPHNISLDMVEEYMDCLPSNYVPKKGTKGERNHAYLYLMQLPPQDFSPDSCHQLTEIEKRRLVKSADKRRTKSSGVGVVTRLTDKKKCFLCCEDMRAGSVCITAERASPDQVWHPACFKCKQCSELLVELAYYYNEENKDIYCGRHFAELKLSRCFGCDEIIFSDTYTEAEGKNWHKEHFCCDRCDSPLQGKNYGQKEGKIFCEGCFERYEAKDCCRCRLPITLGMKQIVKKEKFFHEDCFICKRCRESLFERRYYEAENDFLCEECLPKSSQCSVCKEGILPSVKHLRHENQSWHTECFNCISCKKSLIDEGFHIFDSNVMCKDCYVEKVSQKCKACQKAILDKGIQFNYSFYHSQCFRCTDCKQMLSGKKIQEKQGNVYCSTCVLKFSKRCSLCKQPITSRYTVYNRQPYHIQCFKCSQCDSVIGNDTFFESSLGDVLCDRCGNNPIV